MIRRSEVMKKQAMTEFPGGGGKKKPYSFTVFCKIKRKINILLFWIYIVRSPNNSWYNRNSRGHDAAVINCKSPSSGNVDQGEANLYNPK